VHERLGGVGIGGEDVREAEEIDDLLETGGAELGGAVFDSEVRRVDLFEQNEFTELFATGGGGLFPGNRRHIFFSPARTYNRESSTRTIGRQHRAYGFQK